MEVRDLRTNNVIAKGIVQTQTNYGQSIRIILDTSYAIDIEKGELENMLQKWFHLEWKREADVELNKGFEREQNELLLTQEEINKQVENYTNESRSLWRSSKHRMVKVDEVMGLTSVYERIAKAQLTKVLDKRLDRPDREKIAEIIYGGSFGALDDKIHDVCLTKADQILAPMPDIEEAKREEKESNIRKIKELITFGGNPASDHFNEGIIAACQILEGGKP